MRVSTFRRDANFKREGDAHPPPELFKIQSKGTDEIGWRSLDAQHSRWPKDTVSQWTLLSEMECHCGKGNGLEDRVA